MMEGARASRTSTPLHPWRPKVRAAFFWAAMVAIAGRAFAADEKDDPWQFLVTVPVWGASIQGDVTSKGRTADVDVGFDDLWEHLDACFLLGVEARKEKFGFYGDVAYMKFSADGVRQAGTTIDLGLKFLVSDLGIAYRLIKTADKHPFLLEALAGVRYWYIETDLKTVGPGGSTLADTDDHHHLLDPVIGLRGSLYFAPKWHLDFQGDIGGFGISSDSADFDWSAAGVVTYDLNRWLSLSAGYKALAVDVERHSGADAKGVDVVLHGP